MLAVVSHSHTRKMCEPKANRILWSGEKNLGKFGKKCERCLLPEAMNQCYSRELACLGHV